MARRLSAAYPEGGGLKPEISALDAEIRPALAAAAAAHDDFLEPL
jgi:hypothetical protein